MDLKSQLGTKHSCNIEGIDEDNRTLAVYGHEDTFSITDWRGTCYFKTEEEAQAKGYKLQEIVLPEYVYVHPVNPQRLTHTTGEWRRDIERN